MARRRHGVSRRARVERRPAADQRRTARRARRAASRSCARAAGRECRRGRARRGRRGVLGRSISTRSCATCRGGERLPRVEPKHGVLSRPWLGLDLADVRGQAVAKRALVVAAAGGHNLLMIGPPGSGKSMLAERLSGLLPPLTHDEMLRVASIASVAGDPRAAQPTLTPPFRAPHHTTSRAGARRRRHAAAARRDLARASRRAVLGRAAGVRARRARGAARAARKRRRANLARPRAAGVSRGIHARRRDEPVLLRLLGRRHGSLPLHAVRSSSSTAGRISGPLLDRFDLHVEVPRVSFADITEPPERGESARAARHRRSRAQPAARARRQAQRTARLRARCGASSSSAPSSARC